MLHLLFESVKMLSRNTYLILAVVWTLLTLWLSLTAAGNIQKLIVFEILSWDKAAHFGAYFLFSFLWCGGLNNLRYGKFFVIIFSVSFGVLMEIIQFYSSNGRTFELDDIFANTIGVLAGILVFNHFNK